MLPKYLDHYSHGGRVWPAVLAAAIAGLLLIASVSLPGCASQGLVDAQTVADQLTIKLGDSLVLLGVRVDDIVAAHRAGNLTLDQADAKLAEVRKWQNEIAEANELVKAGNLAAGDRTIAAVKKFLLELKDYLARKGWAGGG